jgi:hypothetical protein
MNMQRITVTFFANYSASAKREERIGLEELADLIRRTSADTKDALPWLKLARFGDQRTAAGSLRHNANVLAITGVECDYDDEQIDVDTAVQLVTAAGISAIVYTSPSHTEDTPRWRVLCPLAAEYPPAERDRFFARLNGAFSGIFARESWVLSQSFYYGSVQRNPSHRVVVVDGIPIDQTDWLDARAIGRPEEPARGQPPAPASRPEQITDARLRGLFASLLDNIRGAAEGEKHFALWRIGKTLGGHLHHAACPWGEAEAIEQLLAALPASVRDWQGARKTARDAIQAGQRQPLDLEERPRDAVPVLKPFERLWDIATALAGTPGAAWFETLRLGHLIGCPELRFHPACHHPAGGRFPAVVAAIRSLDGALIGALRIYIRHDGTGLADTASPRAAMGSVMSGAIRLAPIEDVTAAGALVVAVDLEEAAALGLLMGRPAWAAATVPNLAGRNGIALPREAWRAAIVTVGSDGAATSAWRRFRREDREAHTFTPPDGAHGYVDQLKKKSIGRKAA